MVVRRGECYLLDAAHVYVLSVRLEYIELLKLVEEEINSKKLKTKRAARTRFTALQALV